MRKLSFLLNEVLADMGFSKKTHIWQWGLTLCFAAIMMRVTGFMHHLGQYFILKVMDCPVEEFETGLALSRVTYGFYFIYQEILVTAMGPTTNLLFFYMFIKVNQLSDKYILCFPQQASMALLWYGFFTIFDFVIITVIDFSTQNDDGDIFKLYNYFLKDSG